MHGKKMTVAEWQAVYDSFDLDVNKQYYLLDPQPSNMSELIWEFEPYGYHLMYVKWKDRQLCLDSVFGWQIFDMKVADPENNGFHLPLSPEFGSLEAALNHPVLDGKSIRERFDECRFYGE